MSRSKALIPTKTSYYKVYSCEIWILWHSLLKRSYQGQSFQKIGKTPRSRSQVKNVDTLGKVFSQEIWNIKALVLIDEKILVRLKFQAELQDKTTELQNQGITELKNQGITDWQTGQKQYAPPNLGSRGHKKIF